LVVSATTKPCFLYSSRYALELKEKVILNTEQNGAAKIQEDTENLKQEFEKLMTDVQDLRQKLTSRGAQLEEVQKVYGSVIIKGLDRFSCFTHLAYSLTVFV
jgi:uncharacterized protein YlxW (UPF0749 family)